MTPFAFSYTGLLMGLAACVLGWAIGYAGMLYRRADAARRRRTPPVEPGTKFCRDCRWCKPHVSLGPAYGRCMHPEALRARSTYLAAGEYTDDNQQYCTSMREDKCGEAARLWEPR